LDWGEQDFWERIPIDQLLFQYRMYSIPALQNHTNFLKDLVQWTFVNELLTLQPDGDLGPNRVVERPHIMSCGCILILAITKKPKLELLLQQQFVVIIRISKTRIPLFVSQG
jgi:hypothetical protein